MSATIESVCIAGRDWPKVKLVHADYSAEVLPSQGFSIISFKRHGREFIDAWDLEAFSGTDKDLEFVSREVTDTFRKGFGPSIGPWFGGRFEGDKTWNHGVCRFADWGKSYTVKDSAVTGRLNGAQIFLLGKTLDAICGYHLDVEITYELSDKGLTYRVRNFSEGKKGTFGIHWYWKNPQGSTIAVFTDREPLSLETAPPLTRRLDNGALGPDALRGRLLYPDQAALNFFHTDSFRQTTLFSTKQAFCFEPVSGVPWQVGTFEEGEIRITAQ